MTLSQFLLILRARRYTVLVMLILSIAAAVAASFLLPKQYTATTALLVDVKSNSPLANVNLPVLAMPGYMSTQVDVIKSNNVSERVVELLGLDKNPQLVAKWRDETDGKGEIRRWVAELIAEKLSVRPARESNVIDISYSATDPKFAAVLADTFARAYIETSVALSVEPAQQYSAFFDKRIEELRANLETAQRKLADYEQQHGILGKDERLDIENQRLAELQTQYVAAVGQDVDSSSKHTSAAGDTLPEVLQSPVISTLKNQIATTEAKLQDLGGNLGRNHPQYQASEAELASLKSQLADEIARVTKGVDTAGRISESKVGKLRVQMDAAKNRLLELKRNHAELDLLQQDVETAQKAFDAVSARGTETHMQSQSNQTNVVVLSKASPPVKASSPRVLLNLALGVVVGLILGVGLALIRELADRRLLSVRDLEQLPGFLILAELPAK